MKRNRLSHALIALAFALQTAIGLIGPVYAGTTGIVSGTVTDYSTGERLAGVNVVIEGTNLTTVTDANGYYVITNVPPGEHKVRASLVGYSEVIVPGVSVIMDVTSPLDFALEQSVEVEEEVVVIEARPTIKQDVVPTMYLVTETQEQMIRNQPMTLYQTPDLVSTQPGVVMDEQGYPHIRGGRVNQVGYMLDGIPITEPLTNGFGTNLVTVGLDKMQIYTGGYRPEYGNAISGVFNQVVKTGSTSPGMKLELLGGSQSFRGIYPELGGGTEDGLDYYVGAYVWRSNLEGVQDFDEVESNDAIGKFNYQLSDKNKLTLLLANGSAKFWFPYLHTQTYGPDGFAETAEVRDNTHQSYSLGALTLSHTINSSSFFTFRPYFFRSKNKVDALSDDIGFWWTADSDTTGLQFDYTNQLSQNHLLKTGAIYMSSKNKYWANVPAYGNYEYIADTDTIQTGIYLQDQMRLNDRWRADVGLRYDQMRYDKKTNPDSTESQLSPRLGVSYALDSNNQLRFSYGKMIQFVYSQALERQYVDPMWDFYYGNADLKPERCTQYDFGWERQVRSDLSVQVTPFYRKYHDLLQTTFLDPSNPEISPIIYKNLGEGTSSGLEVLIRKQPSKNWSGWLSYTYSTAKATSSDDRSFITPGQTYYVDWDQRHTLNLVVNYSNDGWRYSLSGRYGSGLPYGEENLLRAPGHVVFNLNIAKEISGGWFPSGEIRFGVANIFNQRTPLDYAEQYDPNTYEVIGYEPSVRIPPRFFSLSFARTF